MLTTKVVYIPKGTIGEIISYLEDKSYEVSYPLDKYIIFFLGVPQSGWIQTGDIKLRKGDFLYKLTKAKAAVVDITLIPGETTQIFFKQLSEKLNLSEKELLNSYMKLASYPEGNFYPETYKIPMGISEYHLVHYLLKSSRIQQKELAEKIFGKYNEKKWYKYLIVASIIQKEAANNDEMPLISSVIYNRLKKKMKLQMDGTLNYGYNSHVKITAKMIREDNSKLNTYKYAGLPPIPVCNPGTDAIKAAIFPKDTDFLYFVKNKATSSHKFSNNFQEHSRAIKQN